MGDVLNPDIKACINMSMHASKILLMMNEHRNSSQKLCDVIIKVGASEFFAHRSVLASCSPYFLAMFNGDMMESTQKVINLSGVKPHIMGILNDFAYTGMLDVREDNVQQLLAASTLFQFPEICDLCCKFLELQLDPSNCVGIRKYAEDHSASQFLPIVDCYILENFTQIIDSDEYQMLPYKVLEGLIGSFNLNVRSEEQVFLAVSKWIHFNVPERGYLIPKLLKNIKMPLLPIDFIMTKVETETLIRKSLESRDLIDEAKNYHLKPDNHSKLRNDRCIPRKSTTGYLYAVGGKEAGETITDKCEKYSMYRNRWETICSLTTSRQQLGVCELHNKIYAIAGSDGVNRLNTAEVYDMNEDVWTEIEPLKTCRSGVGVGVLGDSIFALGGYDGRLCLESVERFDSQTDTWSFVASLNQTRSFPGVAVHGGRMFVIGGNDGTNFLSSCEVYDPLSNRWSAITGMQRPRAGIGAAVVDGLIYVAGGFDGARRLDLVEMYEPRMNKWIDVSNMNFCRDGVSLVKYGKWLYAIGGIDGPSYLNCAEYYDPLTDTWHEVVSMATSRAAAGVAVLLDEHTNPTVDSSESAASLC